MNTKKIVTAKETGFCFGVKRAIGLAEKTLQENKKDVFILGDLIHNREVTKSLEEKGLNKVDDIEQKQGGTLIIRAHGLSPSEIDKAKRKGIKVVDATCPIVTKAQAAATQLEKEGYQVLIVGDKLHAEIKGIVASLKKEALVISSASELNGLKLARRVGLIFQTTQSINVCQEVLAELLNRVDELKVINTICSAIKARQNEAVNLAKEVDLLIVVGDSKSANTIKMRVLCQKYNNNTIQVENADQLNPQAFNTALKIGIVAGASTPEHLIEEVRSKLLG